MQLKYNKNILQAVDGMQKIQSIAWSQNGKRMALVSADRVVQIYNEQGEKQDKFATKAAEKGQKSYIIRALEFSPDSQKIAVAQSDNIVFVYKIGLEWGEKKSICNKFPTSSAVTCMTWPRDRNDVVFGIAEGKVKMGVLRSNKSQLLYQTDSYVVSIGSSRDGSAIVSGHLDCSVYVYWLDRQQYSRIFVHHSIPYALGWGEHIVAAGNDAKVSFYDQQGNFIQRFDYTNDDQVRDFVNAAFNPSGDTVVLGNFNRFYVYNFNKKREQWEEIGVKKIENYYTVTSLCWKNDGSKLVTGSLCGSVDLFDASLRKVRYKGKFEFNYVSPSQIVIQTLQNGSRNVIKTQISPEISRINVLQDRFVVANTLQTLIIGDLETNKISEIMWRGSGNEKYDFSNPNVCMVYNAGELTLVEYGNNEPLGNCRTEHVKPHLISTRLCYSDQDSQKSIAYLLDLQTICVLDLNSGSTLVNINHDSKIDFLELNARANKLIFRDKRRQLYLYNLKTMVKNTLLNYCNYAQWVPDSEVVVAQNRQNLCVWYSIENPDKVTIYNIKGDVESIERCASKTEVIVNEANNQVAYTLDEPMIEFGFAVENRELEKAASILDPQYIQFRLEVTPEIEANWRALAKIALENQDIIVAEHCYASLGDISRATYLRKTQKIAYTYEQEQQKEGITYYKVQARLALLEKQFNVAEALYLDHDEVEEAMDFYQELHKWDESIKIAERKNHPDVKELKQNYFQWLLDTNQEGKGAEVKEHEGDFIYAIQLYLKGGLPAKAANVVFTYNMSFPQDVLEKIATSLSQNGMYEKAGEFYEQMDMLQKSLDCYCKGFAFGKAVDLAKRAEPRLVVNLEERWGDWLVSQKQTESAVNHYIEAGSFQKAVEAAINAKQWSKAVQLLQGQSPEVSRPFFRQIAKHYSEVRQQDLAEKYFLKAGQPVDAFEMYISCQKWDQALRLAKDNLPSNDIVQLYVKQAQKLESRANYKDAEKLFITVEEPDLAIQMYKKVGQYDNMIRLIAKYRKNLLKDTHQAIAQKFQQEGNLKMTEHHYIESGNWHLAVEAYRSSGLWEDAIRVCRQNGNEKETCELAKKWAETLGNEAGMKMLLKLNLVDVIIEYLSDRHDFEEAFKMAKQNAKHKMSDVHLKYALYLEDEQRYKEAEEHFIKAGKPSEAINMYEVQADFHSAIQIARQYEPASVPSIFINQAKFLYDRRDFAKAEIAYISAKKPEFAIKMYTDMNQYSEALRVAKKHAPQLINDINNKSTNMKSGRAVSGEDLMNSAKVWEESRDYRKAIDTYLEIKQEHFAGNMRNLEYAWDRAVQLAVNFDRSRVQEVTNVACQKLQGIKRFEMAGDLYETIGNIEGAVQSYIEGNFFDKARACVQSMKNSMDSKRLMEFIDKSHKAYLKRENKAEELVEQGDVAGLDLYVERGDWHSALESAKQSGPEVLNKYLMRYAKETMESGRFGETITAFAQYGILPIPQNYSIYKTLILEIFADCDAQEVAKLRTCLQKFIRAMEQKQEQNTPAGKEFQKYFMISHLVNLANMYQKKGMFNLFAITSQSILRYCDLVRVDKLFYNAGVACKKSQNLSMAFVLLNRYLDIYEVIEDNENNGNLSELGEFQYTDIPNLFDVPLPEANLISEQDKNNLSKILIQGDWLLQISIDQKISKAIPLRNCESCNAKIWENCTKCPQCNTQNEICVVSGKPILRGHSIQCQSCGNFGTKECWSEYLQNFASCPYCGQPPN